MPQVQLEFINSLVPVLRATACRELYDTNTPLDINLGSHLTIPEVVFTAWSEARQRAEKRNPS